MGYTFETKIVRDEEGLPFFTAVFVISGDCGMRAELQYDPKDQGFDSGDPVLKWNEFIENLQTPGYTKRLTINEWNGNSDLSMKDGVLTFHNSKSGGVSGSASSSVSIVPTAQVREELKKVVLAF